MQEGIHIVLDTLPGCLGFPQQSCHSDGSMFPGDQCNKRHLLVHHRPGVLAMPRVWGWAEEWAMESAESVASVGSSAAGSSAAGSSGYSLASLSVGSSADSLAWLLAVASAPQPLSKCDRRRRLQMGPELGKL
jgi:hypothetical protein